jgi:hypothetical protein
VIGGLRIHFRSFVTRCCYTGLMVSDVLKERSAFVFRGQAWLLKMKPWFVACFWWPWADSQPCLLLVAGLFFWICQIHWHREKSLGIYNTCWWSCLWMNCYKFLIVTGGEVRKIFPFCVCVVASRACLLFVIPAPRLSRDDSADAGAHCHIAVMLCWAMKGTLYVQVLLLRSYRYFNLAVESCWDRFCSPIF